MQPQFHVVYLLHFDHAIGSDNPRGRAQHYLGYADRLDRRALEHLTGRGSALTRAFHRAGVAFQIARTWPGSRAFERQLKNLKNTPRLCPICNRRAPVEQLALPLEEDLL